MKKIYLIALISAFSLASCVKDKYNLEEVKLTISPEIAAPLLSASIVVDDFLSNIDSNLLSQNEDKLFEFSYSDTLYSMSLSDFIEDLPEENVEFDFQLEPLEIADIPEVIKDITLRSVTENDDSLSALVTKLLTISPDGFPFPPVDSIKIDTITLPIADAPFSDATFSEGELSVELTNGWKTPLNNVKLVLKNLINNSVIDTLVYDVILPGESKTDVIDMAGKTIWSDLYGDFINVSSEGTYGVAVPVSLDDAITAKVNGSNFVVVSGSAEFPSQEVVNDTIDLDFNLENGLQLSTLKLKDGDLSIQIKYGIQKGAKLYIELPYASKDGSTFSELINVPASGGANPTSVLRTYDLTGYTFDLSKAGSDTNALETRIRAEILSTGGGFIDFDTSNSVSASVTIKDLKPLYIDGYFGNDSISINPESFDFDFGASDVLEKMSFADPVVTLGFHNTFGIPMKIDTLDLTMKNNLDSAKLNGAEIPFDILSADWSPSSTSVQYKTSELALNKTTNIAELINLWPNEVSTGISVAINPDGDIGGNPSTNFAYDNSGMDITLDLTVPVYGKIKGFEITDTIPLDSSITSIFENVESASLRSNVTNGFPLEASVKFYITDENFVILDSLEAADGNSVLIGAASVDVNTGNVIADGIRQSDLVADAIDISLLQNAGYNIIISAVMNTGNDGANVKIYSHYEMDIKIGILAKINIDLDSL
jgi:hypothetical protein